jgi:hypothetical protein
VAGVGLQQRDGLERERARRHAGHARHLGLGAGQPRQPPARSHAATDNVHAGTLYLGHLLEETGGDPITAAAATTRASRASARSACSPRRSST